MAAPHHRILRRQRRISRLLAWLLAPFVAAFAFAQAPPAPNALPQGGQVRVGAGQITQSGNLLLIQQTTPRLGLDWQRFDIGSDATVRFQQPGRGSIALNRITGEDASAIFGRLEANGQVFLTNPNGVMFAPGARVDVGGLVASTLDLSQDDFAAGRYQFAGSGGSVLNLGRIAAEGYVALFGGTVDNQGSIVTAPGGSVVLAAGRAATVSLSDSGLISAVLAPGGGGSVVNAGSIDAEGGHATLAGALVNTSGLVRASSIVDRGGEIHILGEQVRTAGRIEADGTAGGRIVVRGDMATGRADIGGSFSAQGSGGDGGRVETSAAFVAIDPAARVNTLAASGRHGEWLIDPTDFVVGSGSGAQTSSGIGATTLATNLQAGNVTLQTATTGSEPGDIRVEAPVGWSASTVLTLSAANDVLVRADISATGNAAGLTVSAGSGRFAIEDGARVNLPGSSPVLSINGQAFVVINSLTALQAIGDSGTTLGRNYALGSDIDASATATWNDGAGFRPIGLNANGSYSYFSGDFDGLGHRITGLTINRPQNTYTGLIALANDTSVRHVELAGGSIIGGDFTGALVGYMQGSSLGTRRALQGVRSDVPVTSLSNDTSTTYTGGLVGYLYSGGGGIVDSHATGALFSDTYYGYSGGLAGYVYGAARIADSTASGEVRQIASAFTSNYGLVGGLVGYAGATPMQDVSASGAVSGGEYTGGLVGQASSSPITRASASGAVSGARYASGGLVGYADSSALTDVGASGSVTAGSGSYHGGLAGYLDRSNVTRGTASGHVSGTNASYVGGLVGYASRTTIASSAATGDVSGAYRAGGLVGYFYGADGGAAILDSRASGAVSGTGSAGGLVGQLSAYNYDTAEEVVVARSHATGAVTTTANGGGLIGEFDSGGVVIEDSWASGSVTGTGTGNEGSSFFLGGLIGYHNDYSAYYSYYDGAAPGAIRRSHASGAVSLADAVYDSGRYVYAYAGGLIGYQSAYYQYYLAEPAFAVQDSYATGAVTLRAARGQARAGGLVGSTNAMTYQSVYASGAVAATGFDARVTGGLIASDDSGGGAVVMNSFWNLTTTGQATSAGGGSALTDGQMRQAASFTDWDIDGSPGTGSTWRIYEGQTQPLLRGLLTPLSIVLADAAKSYDGSSSFGDSGITAVGGAAIERPEQILVAGLSKDVGSTAITAASLYSTQQGYDLDVSGSAQFTIAPRTVTLDGVVAGKVYDGSTAAGFVAGAQPTGLVAGEDLTLGLGGASASFADKNVGTGKAVTVIGYSVGDGSTGQAANYTVVGSASADVTPRPVSAGSFSATDRAYDGTTLVAVSFAGSGTLAGQVAGDDLSLVDSGASGQLADKHAGTARPVAVSGVSLAGTDAGNYLLQGLQDTTVTISPRAVTVNGLTATHRAYNGNTSITMNGSAATLAGLVAGDTVAYSSRNLTGTMADRHVGEDKPVTVAGLTLVGPDAANYAPQAAAVTVDITPRQVTGYVYQLYNSTLGGYGYKLYDGSADASAVAYLSGSGLIGSDGVTLTATSISFPDKNVAYSGAAVANRTITASGFALQGQFTGNYTLVNTSNTTTGRIVPRALTVSGVSALDRVYDGTVNVQVSVDGATVDTSQVVPGDDVSVTLPGGGSVTGVVANKNVGTNKAVTVPGLVLGGVDGGNYTLTGSNGVTVDITRKNLTASYTGQDKTYDGTARALVTASSTDIVAGDDIRFYTNEYGNYGCSYGYYGCYASYTGDGAKNVGSNKPISISYDYLYGNDAGNYTLLNPDGGTATGNVLARPITASVTGVNKVYDGTATASVTLNAAASGVVSGDSVAIGTQNAVFTAGKNVGNGKAISVTDITLSGGDAFNYTLAAPTASASAHITPKPVAVGGVSAVDRVYDGTLIVQVNATAPEVSGLIAGDDVSAVLPVGGISSGTMLDRHAGQAKPISITGLSLAGADAANYTLSGSAGSVNIAPKPITVAYTGIDKVYDGTAAASVTGASTGIVGGVGDSVGFAQTAVFSGEGARNAGLDKPIAVSAIRLTGAQAGNYVLEATTAETSADITPRAIGVSYIGVSRPYNGVADVSATVLGSATGLIAGDSVGLNQSARFAGDGAVGSNKTVEISGIELAGVAAGNYQLNTTTATTTASITPRLLGVAGMTAIDRLYDGTTSVQVQVTGAQVDLTGVLAGDVVTVSLPPQGITTGAMLDKHVGQDKPVSVTGLLLGGTDAANYALTGEGALTVDIGALAISASFAGVDKVYDGGIGASVIGSSSGFAAGDGVAIAASAVFTGEGAKNVGTGKPIAVSNAYLTGVDRFNYVLSTRDGTASASITARELSPVYAGITREYDGTVTAPVSATLVNRVGSDQLVVTQTAVYTGAGAKDVGSGKPIAVSGIVLSGADADNYRLAYDATSATGTITPRQIVVEGLAGISATPRTYDGTVNVAVTVPDGLSGTPRAGDVLVGEQVTVNVPAAGATTGTMANKNAGLAKPVLVTGLGLTGADAGNYMIASALGVTVDIAPLAINASYAGVDKVYDGNANAQVTVSLPGRLSGDVLTGSASGVFTAGKNAGSDKEVAVSGGQIAGADAPNYTLGNPTGSTTADILRRQVSATYTGVDKVYDGTNAAQVNGSIGGLIAGDTVTLAQGAVFSAGKNVGSNKAVAVSGITLDGSDAGNYVLASNSAGTTASITPRPVVIEGLTVSAQGREYDGTTAVAVQVQASDGAGPRAGDVIAGDDLTVNVPATGDTSGTMANKHAGTGKAIVVTGLALTGGDAGNYQIAGTAGLTVDIAPRTLTATWTGLDKVYDGTAAAGASGSGDRVIAGDVLTITGSGVFSAGRNAGTGLAIELQSALLGGADAGNYALLNPTGTATAAITPKTLSVSYSGSSKVYDGTTAAPVNGLLGGVIGSDEVQLTQTAVFSDGKNVGNNKPVAVSGIALAGTDAGNYRSAVAATTTSASVTPRPLVIEGLSASAASREYDGTRAVAVDVIAAGGVAPRAGDVIAGDVVSVSAPGTGQAAGTMADKNVGTGKAVVIDGLVLGGADAANYRIEGVGGVTVDITPRQVTAAWSAVAKTYDGTALTDATGTLDRAVAGDALSLLGRGVFTAGKDVGRDLAVEIDQGLLAGADAPNYTLLNPTGSGTASILPRLLIADYTGVNKVYDGTTAASVVGVLDNLVAGETLTLTQSAVFLDGKNVGSNKPVFVAGIAISGEGAGNYLLSDTEASATANITPRPLNVTGLAGLAAQDRVYDGTRSVGLTGTATGLGLEGAIGGDDVRLAQGGVAPSSGTMADKHVGSGKAVVVDGLTLAGTDAGNYQLGGSVGLTVTITPRPVTASGLVAQDRVYDGTLAVVLGTAGAGLSGVLAGDDLRLRLDGATGTLTDKNAGSGKAVTVAGAGFEGSDAGNYTLQGGDTLTVNVAPRPATLTAQAQQKVYGDVAAASGSGFTAEGLVDGETIASVVYSSPGAAATAGVGSYLLDIANASGGSFDPANYVLSYQAAALLVNPRPLTLTALLQSKVYGNVLALAGTEFEVGGSGLVNGDTIGSVPMSSLGDAATAAAGRYQITMGEASGGSFVPANYSISYVGGPLDVTPRDLTIAAPLVIRYAGEANPAIGFATSTGGLVNGDTVTAVDIPIPAESAAATAGFFTLVPGGAQFGPAAAAANYRLTYLNGRLVVLPRPPSLTDDDGGTTGGGTDVALELSPEQLQMLKLGLQRQIDLGAQATSPTSTLEGRPPATGGPAVDPAVVLAALLRGEVQQVTLETLQRLPLISLDPVLLRMLRGSATAR